MKPFFRYVLRQTVLVNLLFVLAMAVGLFSLFDQDSLFQDITKEWFHHLLFGLDLEFVSGFQFRSSDPISVIRPITEE